MQIPKEEINKMIAHAMGEYCSAWDGEAHEAYEEWYKAQDIPEHVEIWEPFEDWTSHDLLELIDTKIQALVGAWGKDKPIRDLIEAVRDIGVSIEDGDPQAIADKWVHVIKPLLLSIDN